LASGREHVTIHVWHFVRHLSWLAASLLPAALQMPPTPRIAPATGAKGDEKSRLIHIDLWR
jgi:hypothetical protein